jgi:hypothetical protein
MRHPAIEPPPVFKSDFSPEAVLILFGALALAAVVYAAYLTVRGRDPLPLAACLGAAVCALNEPIYDTLGKLVYAHVPSGYVAYDAFARHIPWSIVVGYIPWVGLVPYLLSQRMAAGITRSRLYVIAAALVVSVGILEVINALWMHDWRYYAPESGRGVLAGGIIQMASMPLLGGFMLYAFAGRAKRLGRALLGIVIPAMALPMVFASTSWPLYVSNYASVSQPIRWVAALASVALCVAAVAAVAYLAERWHRGERALDRRHEVRGLEGVQDEHDARALERA